MLLTIGISIFTTFVRYSISEAQAGDALQRVGTPFRVETTDTALPHQLNLGAIALFTAINRRDQISQTLRVGDGG